jgi:hypothetical protein
MAAVHEPSAVEMVSKVPMTFASLPSLEQLLPVLPSGVPDEEPPGEEELLPHAMQAVVKTAMSAVVEFMHALSAMQANRCVKSSGSATSVCTRDASPQLERCHMANVVTHRVEDIPVVRTNERQAYQILHIAFVIAPVIAGLDKFAGLLANWDAYLAPPLANMLGGSAHTFMLVVGVVEIVAGLIVAVRPRIGAYVVAAWLAAIVVNLLVSGRYLDIALRDFGLFLAAIALGRLASTFDRHRVAHVAT